MNLSERTEFLPVTALFFSKFCFSLRTSYKELIYCTKNPNAHICTFCEPGVSFDGAFSLWVSLLILFYRITKYQKPEGWIKTCIPPLYLYAQNKPYQCIYVQIKFWLGIESFATLIINLENPTNQWMSAFNENSKVLTVLQFDILLTITSPQGFRE